MRAGLSRVEWPTDWIFRSSQISCIWRATAKAVSLGRTRAGARWPEDRQAQARRSPAAPRQWRSLADHSVMLPARRHTAPAIRSPRLRRPANAGRGCGGQWFGACERPARRRHEQRGSGPGARRRSGRVTDRLAGHGSTPRVTSRNPEHTDRSGVVLETRCRRGESISAAAPLTNNPRGARQLDAGSRHNLVFGGSTESGP